MQPVVVGMLSFVRNMDIIIVLKLWLLLLLVYCTVVIHNLGANMVSFATVSRPCSWEWLYPFGIYVRDWFLHAWGYEPEAEALGNNMIEPGNSYDSFIFPSVALATQAWQHRHLLAIGPGGICAIVLALCLSKH